MSRLPEQHKELSPTEFINQAYEHRFNNSWVHEYFAIQFEKYGELIDRISELEDKQIKTDKLLAFLENYVHDVEGK